MIRFHNPELLWLLWLVPVLWIVTIVSFKWSRRRLESAFGNRLAPFLAKSVSHQRQQLRLILRCLALSFAILALARPQSGESKQEVKSQGFELIFAVDVSESMMAEDVKPSRLEQVKSELSRLIDMMPGNRVGIVAFAGSAVLLSPLTSDPAALKMYLDSLSPISVSEQGTNFRAALDEAKAAFDRGGLGNTDGVIVTRAILMASDGEDHEPGAIEMAGKLAKEKIRLFSLAYGTELGAKIPERDSLGYLRGYKKDSSGKEVTSQVDGKELQLLAQTGQGSFYHAALGGDHLSKLLEDFNRLEKTQFESQMAVQYEENFQWFLIVALICLCLDLIISERRNDFRIWRGRFEIPPA